MAKDTRDPVREWDEARARHPDPLDVGRTSLLTHITVLSGAGEALCAEVEWLRDLLHEAETGNHSERVQEVVALRESNAGLQAKVERLRDEVERLRRPEAEAWGSEYCCSGSDCGCQGKPINPPSWWTPDIARLRAENDRLRATEQSITLALQTSGLADESETTEETVLRLIAFEAEIDRLRAQLAEAQECLSGVVWLLEQGALVRDIRDDAQSDYPARSMRFVAFLARMVRAAGLRTAEGEGDG